MLNALLSLYSKPTPSVAEDVGNELKDYIIEHIELERQAIDTYE
jgi:hypothetical protein